MTNFTINFTAGIGILNGVTTGSPPDTDNGVVLLDPNGVPADGPPDCADGFGIVAAVVGLSTIGAEKGGRLALAKASSTVLPQAKGCRRTGW